MNTRQSLYRLVCAAVFASVIAVTTAYILHIPLPTGGYIHPGDALIYLCACLLPSPWAMAAAAMGAGLADLLTAPMWVLPTLIIKALVCLPFTCKHQRILCPGNLAAVVLAGLLSPTLYGVAGILMAGTAAAFLPQFLGTLIQAAANSVIFIVLALAADRLKLKHRLQLDKAAR